MNNQDVATGKREPLDGLDNQEIANCSLEDSIAGLHHQKQIRRDFETDDKQRDDLYRNSFIEKGECFHRGYEQGLWVIKVWLQRIGLL